MLFSKHLSKAPDQLELHKAALLYHKQKHTLPPMQQVQKTPVHSPEEFIQPKAGVSSDSQISIGNVFQDGTSSLPVIYLPEHHLVRLREVKMQRIYDISSPTVARQEVEEIQRVETSRDAGENKLVQEEQLPKTDELAHKTSIRITHLFRTHFNGSNIRTFSNRLSKKSPRAETEEKANSHIQEATRAATEPNPIPPAPFNDSNWPLPALKSSSTFNLASLASAEQSHDFSENTITVEEDSRDEGYSHNLESTKISESITEKKHELDIGPSEASRIKLYQAWKRRILDLSGAKEVN